MRRPRQWEMGSLDKYVGMIFTGVVLLSMANIVVTLVILHYLMGIGGQYYLLYALAIVPVVNAVVGLSLRRFGRKRYQREQALVESINRVAQGDLNVWLNEQDAGSFEMVYQNFNKMVLGLRNQKLVNENFINDFSHELKTPIASIHGFAEVLLSEDLSEEERQEFLQIIADESNRLADLAKNTLMLSKIDSQQLLPSKETFALDEQIKQCMIILSAKWEAKQIDFTAQLPEVKYWGNEELLQQVWLNLFSNAIKFTPEGGTVTVDMGRLAGQLAVTVTDSGPGMPPEVQAHIFEQYYQGDASRSMEGHGLGLAIVKRIVELHGGKAAVQSVPGKGSTFIVWLPLENGAEGELPELAVEIPPNPAENILQPPPAEESQRHQAAPEDSASAAASKQLRVETEQSDAPWFKACYSALGWQLISEKEMMHAGQMKTVLSFEREAADNTREQQQRLQKEGETLLAALSRSKRRIAYEALAKTLVVALGGVAALAAALAAYLAGQKLIATVAGLAAMVGIVAPYFLHQYFLETALAKQTAHIESLHQQLTAFLKKISASQ